MRAAMATRAASTKPGPRIGNSLSTTFSLGSSLSRVSMSEQRALAVATCGSTVLRELQFRLPPYPCRQYAGATSEPKTRQIVEGADLVLEGGVNLNDITINYGLRSRI